MLTLDGRQDLPGSHFSTYRRFDRPVGAVGAVANGMMKESARSKATVQVTEEVPHQHRHMWMVTGPAGCGKSTVAEFLASELGIPFIEGDDVCRDQIPILRLENDRMMAPLMKETC